MFAVGAMLGGGHEVPENREEAQSWYRRAAEKGHAHAQLMLGRFLMRGLAGERNDSEAREWLEKAKLQGMGEADAELQRLASETAGTAAA
jgi:TPR repeat protein